MTWEDGNGEETTAKKGHHKKGRQIFFKKKWGDTHQLPPRVTPTLVTPLLLRIAVTKATGYVNQEKIILEYTIMHNTFKILKNTDTVCYLQIEI